MRFDQAYEMCVCVFNLTRKIKEIQTNAKQMYFNYRNATLMLRYFTSESKGKNNNNTQIVSEEISNWPGTSQKTVCEIVAYTCIYRFPPENTTNQNNTNLSRRNGSEERKQKHRHERNQKKT